MQIDSFTIICHDGNDDLFDIAAPYIQCGIENGFRVHILSYNKMKRGWSLSEQVRQHIIWKEADRLESAIIGRTIENLGKQDILVVFGAEKLVPSIGKKVSVQTDFLDKTASIHYEQDEDWDNFCEKLDHWYAQAGGSIGGLFLFLCISEDTERRIAVCLEKSENMAISSIRFEDPSYTEKRKIFDAILSRNYTVAELEEMIEENHSIFGETTCRYMKAVAYKISGSLQSAIDILKEIDSKDMDRNIKLLLADCYYMDNRGSEALEMLEDMYQKEPYTRGLAETLIRASRGTPKEKQWIEILYRRFPENAGVLEAYASLKSQKKEYKAAAHIFWKLSFMQDGHKKNAYELTARLNDLLDKREESDVAVWKYLLPVIDREPTLRNEAVFRCVGYFANEFKDMQAAIRIMEHADIRADQPYAEELATSKMNLMKYVATNASASRNFVHKQVETLLEAMTVLCCNMTAYSRWRNYLDSMPANEWNEALYLELLRIIPQFAEIDFDTGIQAFSLEQHSEALRLLATNSGYVEKLCQDGEELAEILKGALICAKLTGSFEDEAWACFYGSIIFSNKAEFQNANNYALTLFHNAQIYRQSNLYIFSGYLGLLAWGINQYRIGNKVEGAACVMASFFMAGQLQKYVPFLECGIPILTLFLLDNYDDTRKSEREAVEQYVRVFSGYCPLVADYFQVEDAFTVIISELSVLTDQNILPEEKLRSALKIVNHMGKLCKEDDLRVADIVLQYGDIILNAMQARRDSLEKVCLLFAQILWARKREVACMVKIYGYIKQAIYCVEEHKVFHQEERAGIAQNAATIYRFYLDFLIAQKLQNKGLFPDGTYIDHELFECVQKLLPLTLEEQNIYNNECLVTEEDKEQFQHYLDLFNEYQILKRNSKVNDRILQDLEQNLEDCICGLKERNPYFQPLAKVNIYSLKQARDQLEEGGAVIHFVLRDAYLIIILISCSAQCISIVPYDTLKEQLEEYAEIWKIGDNQEECQKKSDDITKQYFSGVYDFIKEMHIKNLYIISDFSLGIYSLTGSRCGEEYLITLVDSIVHITNYNVLWRDAIQRTPVHIYNEIYGSCTDNTIQQINTWLDGACKRYANMHAIDSHDKTVLPKDASNAYIVYGHGFHRENVQSMASGALGIWDGGRIVKVRDILENIDTKRLDYFFLMSCAGGLPVGKEADKDQGSWAQMIEALRGGIIGCRWDVRAEAVCRFLTVLLDSITENEKMDRVFLKTLRKLQQQYSNLEDWAGFEYWEN